MNKLPLKNILLVAIGLLFLWPAFSFRKKNEGIGFVRPKGWPKPVYNLKNNRITEAGFKLGRKLFYDPILSRDGTISCASCHTQWSAFTHIDHGLSHGIEGRKGKRNSLSLFNLAWNTSFMWDGGINNLEVQPLGPITNKAEMDNTLENVVKHLDTSHTYRTQFYNAFGDSTITGQRVLKALAQFTVIFQSYNSRYDKYMRKEAGGDMSPQELHGLDIIRDKCSTCHPEPLFTNYTYQNTGLPVEPDLKDYGRMTITGVPADSLKFKVPSLRNVAITYPYMHDGRFKSIRQVLDHYTGSIVESPTLAKEFKQGMLLSDQDKKDIIAFLETLTDREFLQNPLLKEQ